MVVEVGELKEKSAPEKVPISDDVTTVGIEGDQEAPESSVEPRESNSCKACCQVLLALAFCLLLIASVFFSYRSFSLESELRNCAKNPKNKIFNVPNAMPDFTNNRGWMNEPKKDMDNNKMMPALPNMEEDDIKTYKPTKPMGDDDDLISSWQGMATCLQDCVVITSESGVTEATIDAGCLGRKLEIFRLKSIFGHFLGRRRHD